MENLYKIEALKCQFKNTPVINDISFVINKGEIIGLLGPNGAGKSTLINLLTGVILNYSGEIFFRNLPIRNREKEIKANISAVLDRSAVYENITVEQNIIYYCKLLGLDVQDSNCFLEEFELHPYKKYIVGQLSSGFKQRLKIVIALLNNPSIIFLDEPWLALDPINSKFLTEKISDLNKTRGITFFIAAHDLTELDTLCSRFLFLRSGNLILNFSKGDKDKLDVYTIDGSSKLNQQSFQDNCFFSERAQRSLLINPDESLLKNLSVSKKGEYTLKDLYFELLA